MTLGMGHAEDDLDGMEPLLDPVAEIHDLVSPRRPCPGGDRLGIQRSMGIPAILLNLTAQRDYGRSLPEAIVKYTVS